MTTWDEWYSYLDGLVDASVRGQLADIRDFFREAERCRSELGLPCNDPRVRILDELWQAALLLIYLDMLAAEPHRRAAASLYARWKLEGPYDRSAPRTARRPPRSAVAGTLTVPGKRPRLVQGGV